MNALLKSCERHVKDRVSLVQFFTFQTDGRNLGGRTGAVLPVRSWGQDALKKALPDAPSSQTVDFIVTGHSEELLRMMVKPLVESFLTERGLVPSPWTGKSKQPCFEVTKGSCLRSQCFGIDGTTPVAKRWRPAPS